MSLGLLLPLEVGAPHNDCACIALNGQHGFEGKSAAIAAGVLAGAAHAAFWVVGHEATSINYLRLVSANHINDNRIPGHNPKRGTSERAKQVSVRTVIGERGNSQAEPCNAGDQVKRDDQQEQAELFGADGLR